MMLKSREIFDLSPRRGIVVPRRNPSYCTEGGQHSPVQWNHFPQCSHFVAELASLRECVQELRLERDDLCRVGSRWPGGESTQEDEDTGDPFSGFDGHGPG